MSLASISVEELLAAAPDAAWKIASKRVESGRFDEAEALVLDGVPLFGPALKELAKALGPSRQARLAKALVGGAESSAAKGKGAQNRAFMWLSIFAAEEPAFAESAMATASDAELSERMSVEAYALPKDLVPGGEMAGVTALDAARMAAMFGDAASLAELLRRLGPGAGEGGIEEEAPTALHWAAASPEPGGAECVRMLLAAGADPNRPGYFPETVSKATASNWVGASVDGEITPLGAAALAGRTDAVELLLEAGGKPEASADGKLVLSPFGLACAFGRVEVLEKMEPRLDWDALNQISDPGGHLTRGLHAGSSASGFEVVFNKKLKEAGAQVRVATAMLHRQATVWRSKASGRWLAEAGADCSAVLALIEYENLRDPEALAFVEELAVSMASTTGTQSRRMRI